MNIPGTEYEILCFLFVNFVNNNRTAAGSCKASMYDVRNLFFFPGIQTAVHDVRMYHYAWEYTTVRQLTKTFVHVRTYLVLYEVLVKNSKNVFYSSFGPSLNNTWFCVRTQTSSVSYVVVDYSYIYSDNTYRKTLLYQVPGIIFVSISYWGAKL